jgi:hypothetical protein
MDKMHILIQLDNSIFSKKVESILDDELVDSELWYWEGIKKKGTFLLTVPNHTNRSLSLLNHVTNKLQDEQIHCLIMPLSSQEKIPH